MLNKKKKKTIASRHSELPPTFIADAWKLQKDLILAIFSNSTTHMNYAAAARVKMYFIIQTIISNASVAL